VPSATILFADFKGFTLLAERMEPAALVGLLDQYFTAFDDAIARHELEKLKTIGDAYMAVAGALSTNRRHPFDACLAALGIHEAMSRMNAFREKIHLPALELRIGIHTGPVIAGVVGKRKFTFDIWGDAVNTAALMEANGAAGRINVSETVAGHVRPLFELEPRGLIETKHHRPLEMFFLNRLKPGFSQDAEGHVPNEKFSAERSRLLTGF
jgi:adenylate cyclase